MTLLRTSPRHAHHIAARGRARLSLNPSLSLWEYIECLEYSYTGPRRSKERYSVSRRIVTSPLVAGPRDDTDRDLAGSVSCHDHSLLRHRCPRLRDLLCVDKETKCSFPSSTFDTRLRSHKRHYALRDWTAMDIQMTPNCRPNTRLRPV